MGWKTKEARLEYQRKYTDKNRVRLNEQKRIWVKKNWERLYQKHLQFNATIEGLFSRAKGFAKFRKLEWALDLATYTFLRSQLCFYCNGTLPKGGSALDRIDSNKGYTPDNVRPCCEQCNSAKSNWSESEFKDWLIRITNECLLKNKLK